jgi:DNA-binding MarR family transcriptional regulator
MGLTNIVTTTIVIAEVMEMGRQQGGTRTTKTARRLGEEAVIAVLRVANRLNLEVAAMLKPRALTVSQYNALRIMRGAGEGGVTCGQLGERMLTHDPDITRLIDRLERAGWAARERSSTDRRVVTGRITPAGLALLAALDEEVAEFDRRIFAALDDERLAQLVASLQTVLAG